MEEDLIVQTSGREILLRRRTARWGAWPPWKKRSGNRSRLAMRALWKRYLEMHGNKTGLTVKENPG